MTPAVATGGPLHPGEVVVGGIDHVLYRLGEPDDGYPFRWCVAPWLPGTPPDGEVAADLAAFLRRLRAVDAGPAPAVEDGSRGGPLSAVDSDVRATAGQLRGDADVARVLEVWRAGVEAPAWAGRPRWLHGDLTEGNLLVREGRLSAVLDWSGCAAGDPAADLVSAWTLPHDLRAHLPEVDAATWLRARAWAVCSAVMALPYHRDTEPGIVARSRRVLRAVGA